jgi:hypothetical protein
MTSRVRGRVVVVVGGVVPTQGDGSTDRKAKDHSRDASSKRIFLQLCFRNVLKLEMSSRAMESRMR